ncbi:ATP-binding protein [Nitrosopumilus ureiphilus]|nr:ATP-binding protein [Nitrosopumilus ureiphilus]
MKIGIKILLSFFVIIVSIGVMGFLTITTSQEKIIHEIGTDHSETLSQTMYFIDDGMREKILGLVMLSDEIFVEKFLVDSNSNYDVPIEMFTNNTADVGPVSFSVNEILNNDLSIKLQNSARYIENKYRYELYNEIVVVNPHGFIVASVKPLDDVSVDKSDWWDAVVTTGYFIGDVQFDEDSKIYTQDLAYKISDSDGNFIGVLKTNVKLQDIIIMIYDLRSKNKFLDSDISLIDSSGKILYDSADPEFGNYVPLPEYVMMSETSDYLLSTDQLGIDTIHVYAKSQPQRDFPSLGWTLVLKQNTDDLLKPVVGLTNTILIISITTITSAVMVAIYVRSSISKPLVKLKDASVKIAEGDYDVDIDVKTDDEIGDLANKFDYMKESIKFTNENLRELIKLRTDELQNALEEIKNNQSFRDEMTESFTKKILAPISSLVKNIELFKNEQNPETLLFVENDLMQLKTTTDDFIDYYMTRTNTTQYDMTDTSINQLMSESVALFDKHPKSSNISLHIDDDDVKVFVDKKMFKRAIFNILDNSLKHSTSGKIDIKTRKIGEKQVEIMISDAREISPDQSLDNLFELKSPDAQTGDDPIGLYVAKSIIIEHAGTIHAQSNDFGGVTFFITLPIFEN